MYRNATSNSILPACLKFQTQAFKSDAINLQATSYTYVNMFTN